MAKKNKETAPKKNKTGTQAIDRALNILSCFDFTHPVWGSTELSKKLNLTISTTLRILKALESGKLLTLNNKTGNFELGLRMFELGAVASRRIALTDQAKEILVKLHDETKQTVHLVIVDGDEMLYVRYIESSDAFRVFSPAGLRRSLATGSLGKAILSTYSQPLLDQYFSKHQLVQYTSRSITDRTLYIEELTKVREQGFATDREELFNGVCAIAAPITGRSGLAIGGVAVVFPALRFDEVKMSEWGQLVRQGGLTISARLSHMEGIPYTEL